MRYVPEAISRKIARQVLLANKNSPNILFGVGVVGFIGTTVLASRATLKLDSVLTEIEKDVLVAKSIQHEEYSEEDRINDLKLIQVQGAIKIAKLYGPAVVVGGLSLAAFTKSHTILINRNTALTAAYVALDRGFAQYRARVVEELGVEKDAQFRYGSEEIEVKNDKTGKALKARIVGADGASIYARFYDESAANWSPFPDDNVAFVRCQQNWANDILRSRGHIFLNEVYDALGLERSKAGAIVGWVMDEGGDNYVDFGVFNEDSVNQFFIRGQEPSVLLDFNVDGVIYDKIENKPRGAIR